MNGRLKYNCYVMPQICVFEFVQNCSLNKYTDTFSSSSQAGGKFVLFGLLTATYLLKIRVVLKQPQVKENSKTQLQQLIY